MRASLVRLVVLAAAQVHRGQPTERLCGVGGRIGVERPRERRLEVLDGLLLVPEEQASARRGSSRSRPTFRSSFSSWYSSFARCA